MRTCENCEIRKQYAKYFDVHFDATTPMSEEDAIKAWNRRAERSEG